MGQSVLENILIAPKRSKVDELIQPMLHILLRKLSGETGHEAVLINCIKISEAILDCIMYVMEPEPSDAYENSIPSQSFRSKPQIPVDLSILRSCD